ncbi:hypothetical protein BS78_06G007600 [Paspalum vaginatum]|nr:hypothetical protein BS78_06G007600 [Paspalum vaginatum]
MEGKGSRRSSSMVALLLLLLALVLAAFAAAAAQRPPATEKSRYMLVEVQAGADKVRMAMREDGSSFAGYANGKQQWFATPGSESLLASYGYYGRGGTAGNSRDNAGVGQGGLGTLLAMAMVVNNNRSKP